jgi:hypothetical protein
VAYLIVQYWEYLAIATGLGVLVGWWAQGSRHGRNSAAEGES